MAGKPKIAMYWLSGCGGCEESVIDLAGDLLALADAADIICWPLAMDFKQRDLALLAEGEICACLINGAVRTEAHAEMARLLRRKSRTVIAHGACAHMGGVVGMGNFFDTRDILDCAYRHQPTVDDPDGVPPGEQGPPCTDTVMALPRLTPQVQPLDRVIAVDGVIPGCPPTPAMMKSVFSAVLGDTRSWPEAGIWGETGALCRTCPLGADVPETLRVDRFKRLHETRWDPQRCFLAQGLVCMGPFTRGGCGARCIAAHMPCRGCFGPVGAGDDAGARGVSLAAAMMGPEDRAGAKMAAESLVDPAGLFYRYSLAASRLSGKRD